MDSVSGPMNCWGVTQISIVTVAGVVIVALMGLWLRWHLKLGKAEERAIMVLGQYDLLESQIGSFKDQIRALADEVRRRDYYIARNITVSPGLQPPYASAGTFQPVYPERKQFLDVPRSYGEDSEAAQDYDERFALGSDDNSTTECSSSYSSSSIQKSDEPEDFNCYPQRAASPLPAVVEARAVLPNEIRIVPVLRSPDGHHHPLSFRERLRAELRNLPPRTYPDVSQDIPHRQPVAEAVEGPRENPFEEMQAETPENSDEPPLREFQPQPILAAVPLRAPRPTTPERVEALRRRLTTPRMRDHTEEEGPARPIVVVSRRVMSSNSPLFPADPYWAPDHRVSGVPSVSSLSLEPVPDSSPSSPLGSPPDLSELGILDWNVSSDMDPPASPDASLTHEGASSEPPRTPRALVAS
ncbi:hypothetical protein B0T25DRAFT_287051 [Lasiosphaeria hispida]|uniref:Uncharacterized protein n=1 Tax=Lasiosphaeria hispida TaxID=260671 RepID=A0AAJ0HBX1_9PEZI|nr:hypothetical protein B0T25DRAFT_287051 [Lasiosphaeria hispida]